MKTNVVILVLISIFAFSCKKENQNPGLLPEYESIIGDWEPLTLSYDSMGVRVEKSIPYQKLEIDNTLSYKIYLDTNNPAIENGSIKLISQINNKPEIYFNAVYPIFSSFAGSHIFDFSNVIIDSISNNQMVLIRVDQIFYENAEYSFKRR
ncbi:MAG: hypothetical protein U0W24_11660 [Bacteroidales bacterium]